jgi:hypothetical protein
MATVWIPANVGHVYTDAHRFGSVKFLVDGPVRLYNTSTHHIEFQRKLNEAKSDDYLLLSGPPVLSVLAAAILARKFGVLNLLLFKNGHYVERNLDLDSLMEVPIEEYQGASEVAR